MSETQKSGGIMTKVFIDDELKDLLSALYEETYRLLEKHRLWQEPRLRD